MTISDATVKIISASFPLVTLAATITLFWAKYYADSRKRLDDLLIELEHAIYMSRTRETIFRERYLEIRKAVTEFERWIINPAEKRDLREAFRRFRGQNEPTESVYSLKGTPHEALIDVFATGYEIRVLAPNQDDFTAYIQRIADLRKITGSRRWADPELPTF